MNQYKMQFGATRIARPGSTDTVRLSYPALDQHIVVLVRDQIFKVQVVLEDGRPATRRQIEQ